MVALCTVDHTDMGTVFLKFLGNALSDAAGTAGNNHNFVLKHPEPPVDIYPFTFLSIPFIIEARNHRRGLPC